MTSVELAVGYLLISYFAGLLPENFNLKFVFERAKDENLLKVVFPIVEDTMMSATPITRRYKIRFLEFKLHVVRYLLNPHTERGIYSRWKTNNFMLSYDRLGLTSYPIATNSETVSINLALLHKIPRKMLLQVIFLPFNLFAA